MVASSEGEYLTTDGYLQCEDERDQGSTTTATSKAGHLINIDRVGVSGLNKQQ